MSNVELSSVIIGDKITDGIYCLKTVTKSNDKYDVVLKDKTGELLCELAQERYSEEVAHLKGGAVKTTFIVKNGLNTKPLGVIKNLTKADEGSYKASDLFDGLSDEKIAEYTAFIRQCINRISDNGYQQLVANILNDETITQLAQLPATLSRHDRYRGGALACTASVTRLVSQCGYQYTKYDNGLYKSDLDWPLLLSASLLQCVGVIDYYTHEQPFTKTPLGLECGYMSILQKRLEKASVSSNCGLSDIQLARILNILASSVPMKSGIKATRQEGILFRQCLIMHEEMDIYDSEMAGFDAEEGEQYFYSAKLHRNIPIPEKEKSA